MPWQPVERVSISRRFLPLSGFESWLRRSFWGWEEPERDTLVPTLLLIRCQAVNQSTWNHLWLIRWSLVWDGVTLRCVKIFRSTGNTQVPERRYDFYLAYAFDKTTRVDQNYRSVTQTRKDVSASTCAKAWKKRSREGHVWSRKQASSGTDRRVWTLGTPVETFFHRQYP